MNIKKGGHFRVRLRELVVFVNHILGVIRDGDLFLLTVESCATKIRKGSDDKVYGGCGIIVTVDARDGQRGHVVVTKGLCGCYAAASLGGRMFDPPGTLLSEETIENAMKFNTDKAFLSPTGILEEGDFEVSEDYYMIYYVGMRQAKKVYYPADRSKWRLRSERRICDFSEVDCVITDFDFPDSLKEKFPKTEFLTAK